MNVLHAFRPGPVAAARAGAAAVCLAALLGATGASFGQSSSPDPVIMVVNGTQVHEGDLEVADEVIGRNLITQDKVERRDTLLKMLTDTILLSQVAKDRNIVDEADLQRRTTFARNVGLMNHLLVTVGQQALSEQAVRKAYEDVVVKAVSSENEMHLRHLVIMFQDPKDEAAVKAAEDKARAALERINKGEDFAAVVADVSDDPVTKARGGDYDWRGKSMMSGEYAEAASKLKKGEVSPLIKTAVGWHIIKLEDLRPRKPAEYEKIKDRVAAMVSNNAQLELVNKVRADAKIEYKDQPNVASKGAPTVK
jgi:peptidyl-prolyl cis-trans isomerase C